MPCFHPQGIRLILPVMIELALPAGSLENALHAFAAGADAVYFGMKEFSARKGAVNFSFEDLSKIKRYAQDNRKKIYVTVNTLVDDSETEKADRLLAALDFYEPDGIIIQDLGLTELVRRYYPSLPLHASTQLAVHTAEGVKELQDLGFERVVLSRELTLDEIQAIRNQCPDIELKVFIHGALCYGFSGLCMASHNICERSANRGECAQVCRTWFTEEASKKNGYFFSMQDLCAGKTLKLLDGLGIESAKIEGRLKGDEYVTALTRYYRSILDGKEDENLEDQIRTTFSRTSGQGYFNYRKNRKSLLSGYPSHLGLEAGTVLSQKKGTITIKAEKKIASHDGLQCIVTGSDGLEKAVKFPCRIISRDGDEFTLKCDTAENLKGKTVYKISSADQNARKISTNIPFFHKPVSVSVTVGKDKIVARGNGTEACVSVNLSEAARPYDIRNQLYDIFSQSADSSFTLKDIEVINDSGLCSPFLPLSILKALRRDFYRRMDESAPAFKAHELKSEKRCALTLPDRKLLANDLPWSLDITEAEGEKYITLPPASFNETELFAKVERILEENPDVITGLNNIAQVRFAKKHPQYRYFADIYLYQSNEWANRLLVQELGDSLVGGYLWIERKKHNENWALEPSLTDYTPPSFISRTCFRHDAMGLSCSTCTGKYDYSIRQNDVRYTVKVRDCLTVVEKN